MRGRPTILRGLMRLLWKTLGRNDLQNRFCIQQNDSESWPPCANCQKFCLVPRGRVLRASSHLSTLWLSCVFRSPTHQPPSTPIFRFLMKSRFKRRRSSKAVLDAYYQRPSAGGRRANAGFMFTRRSPDTHYRRPRHQQTHLVY